MPVGSDRPDSDARPIYRLKNGKVLRGDVLVDNDYVLVRDGVILEPEALFFLERKSSTVDIDLKGLILSPGFIDIQINGGYGVDFTTDIAENKSAVKRVAKGLLQTGVTSFCPTIVTTSTDNYHKIIENFEVFEGSRQGAGCLGLHLEGPFISCAMKGAHDEKFIKPLSEGIKSLHEAYGDDLSKVRIITLAPENENVDTAIKYLKHKGIVVSLGHSKASYEEAINAVANGASMVTHTYNSMAAFHHRNPGIIGLLGDSRRPVHFGLVADFFHTHSAALRLAFKSQPTGMLLVTDAISALGLPDGEHDLGSKVVHVSKGRAVIAGTETLSGSVTPLNECIRNFMKATGCSPGVALAAATMRPAEVLGLQTKGVIKPGADADFVVLDDKFEVKSTWIAGQPVYSSDG